MALASAKEAIYSIALFLTLIILLIVPIVLIAVTYFHEMRSRYRRKNERMKDPVFTTNISIGGLAHFPLIFAADDDERDALYVYVLYAAEIGKVKNYANLKLES